MVAVLVLFPLSLLPANWLSARGLLQEQAAWTAAMNWGVLLAVLVPTTVAAWCEGRPVASFGLPWRASRGRLLAEGVAWGVGAAGLLAGLLHVSGVVRGHGVTPGAWDAIRSGATWALSLLGFALFEQSLKRGYLQSTLGRALGFWQAGLWPSWVFVMTLRLIGAIVTSVDGILDAMTPLANQGVAAGAIRGAPASRPVPALDGILRA